MARYATLQDLYSLGVPEAAFTGGADPITEEAREAGLVASCDMVDSFLSERFTLPLVSYGRDLTRAACIIAAYDLMTANGYNPANQGDDSTQLDKRYNSIIEWLTAISKGQVTPVVTEPETSGGGGSGGGVPVGGFVVAPRPSDDGESYIVGEGRVRGW